MHIAEFVDTQGAVVSGIAIWTFKRNHLASVGGCLPHQRFKFVKESAGKVRASFSRRYGDLDVSPFSVSKAKGRTQQKRKWYRVVLDKPKSLSQAASR